MPLERLLKKHSKHTKKIKARILATKPPAVSNPEIEALVCEIIERVADKWTMLVLETLSEHGELRFTRLAEFVDGVSQKMLTKTVRQMERDGLLVRTVHPVIPPRVEYRLTVLGQSLGAAFCGVWIWAEEHHAEIVRARKAFDTTASARKRLQSSGARF